MSNLLNRVAQRRDERVADLHLDLPIPTWNGDLVARFQILPRNEVDGFIKKTRSPENDAAFLARSVREIYLRDADHEADGQRMDGNDEYVRLEGDDGTPVRFDLALASMLQMEGATRSIEVLSYCFKDNSIAWSGMAAKVITWMQNTDMKVADSLVGE